MKEKENFMKGGSDFNQSILSAIPKLQNFDDIDDDEFNLDRLTNIMSLAEDLKTTTPCMILSRKSNMSWRRTLSGKLKWKQLESQEAGKLWCSKKAVWTKTSSWNRERMLKRSTMKFVKLKFFFFYKNSILTLCAIIECRWKTRTCQIVITEHHRWDDTVLMFQSCDDRVISTNMRNVNGSSQDVKFQLDDCYFLSVASTDSTKFFIHVPVCSLS